MNDETGYEDWRVEAPSDLPEEVEDEPVTLESCLEPEAECTPAPPPQRRPRGPHGWAALIPALLLAAACAYLAVQNHAAAATVEALTTTAPQLMLQGAANPLAGQLDLVRQSAHAYNFVTAAKLAQGLKPLTAATSTLGGPSPLAAPAPDAATEPTVTPEMAAFFKAHPDLEKRLSDYSDQARAARDARQDVQPLRDLRTKILAAAQQGDAVAVSTLLDQFASSLQSLGGGSPASADWQGTMTGFQHAFDQAQKAGRDPSRAVALIRQAQTAEKSGQHDQAVALARQALEALKNAPRASGGRSLSRQPSGLPPTAAQQVLGATLRLMDAEEQNLSAAYAAIEEALRAMREENQDQIREILADATHNLEQIRDRRQAFSAQLSHLGPAKPRPTAAQTPPPAPEPSGPVEKIADLLDQARKLPADQYKEARLSLARGTLEILLSMGPPAPEGPPASGQSLAPAQQHAAEQAEARVREKLQLAQGPYEQLKRSGADTTALDTMFREARAALSEGRLAAAEAKADEALRNLRILPAQTP
jgi:hypothetical protein